MQQCFIGLGSNQADPAQQLRRACDAISQLPDSRVVAVSSLYRTAPFGPADQPDYVNAVLELSTSLSPLALLDALQAIELDQGRVRTAQRWGPRTLDLDILLYGGERIELPRLTVPHYHMHARPFVLYPLAEIAPHLSLPDGTALADLLSKCPPAGIEPLAQGPDGHCSPLGPTIGNRHA